MATLQYTGEMIKAACDRSRQDGSRNILVSLLKALFCVGRPHHGFLLAFGCLAVIPHAFFIVLLNVQCIPDDALSPRFALSAILLAILLVYAVSLCAVAFFQFYRPTIKTLVACLASAVSAILFPVAAIVAMACHFLKKRLVVPLILLLIAFLIGVFVLFIPIPYSWYIPYFSPCLVFAPYLLLAAAILIATKGKPIPHTIGAFAPVYVLIVLALALQLKYLSDKAANSRQRNEIAEIVGFSMSKEGFKAFAESGFSIEEEPLASFLKASYQKPDMLQQDEFLPGSFISDTLPSLGREKCGELLSELARLNPGYEEAVLAFTATRPQKIAHTLDWENEQIGQINVVELGKMNSAATFLCQQICLDPANRGRLVRNNAAMVVLRDCALQGEFIFHEDLAVNIELLRIKALCCTLPNMAFTEDEWRELLGDEPDMYHSTAKKLAVEAIDFEDVKTDSLERMRVPSTDGITRAKDHFHDDRKTHLQFFNRRFLIYLYEADHRFALNYFRHSIELLLRTDHDLAEFEKFGSDIRLTALKRNFHLSQDYLPYWWSPRRFAEVKELRRMANLARLAFEYRAKNGVFPESLDALTDDCTDSICHHPLRYESHYDFENTLGKPPIHVPGLYGPSVDEIEEWLNSENGDDEAAGSRAGDGPYLLLALQRDMDQINEDALLNGCILVYHGEKKQDF